MTTLKMRWGRSKWTGLGLVLLLSLMLVACGENTATPAPTTAPTTVATTRGGTSAPVTTGTALDLAYPNVARKVQLTYDDIFPGLGGKDVSYFQAFITEDTPDKVKQYYSDQFAKLGFSVSSGTTGTRPAEVLAQRASTTLQVIVIGRTEPAAQQQNLRGDQSLVVVLMRNSSSGNPLGPRPSNTP